MIVALFLGNQNASKSTVTARELNIEISLRSDDRVLFNGYVSIKK